MSALMNRLTGIGSVFGLCVFACHVLGQAASLEVVSKPASAKPNSGGDTYGGRTQRGWGLGGAGEQRQWADDERP